MLKTLQGYLGWRHINFETKFEIDKCLGRTLTGDIEKAIDKTTGETFLLKRIIASATEKYRSRFRGAEFASEVEIATQFQTNSLPGNLVLSDSGSITKQDKFLLYEFQTRTFPFAVSQPAYPQIKCTTKTAITMGRGNSFITVENAHQRLSASIHRSIGLLRICRKAKLINPRFFRSNT